MSREYGYRCIAPLTILITLLTGGCVGHRPPYPDDFPPLVGATLGECPDISGQYSNEENPIPGSSGLSRSGIWLSHYLWYREEDKSHRGADKVLVTQPDPDTIEFTAPLKGGRSVRRSLSRDDNGYSCSNGFVVISTPTDAGMESAPTAGAATWEWEELRLAKTSNGSLAVEFAWKEFYLVYFVVPIGQWESTWSLYSAAPETAVKPSSPAP